MEAIAAVTDPAFMTQRQITVAQAVEDLRQSRIDTLVANLLASPMFIDEILDEYRSVIRAAIIESFRALGDPTAFRTEARHIAETVAKNHHPVGSVTVDDI